MGQVRELADEVDIVHVVPALAIEPMEDGIPSPVEFERPDTVTFAQCVVENLQVHGCVSCRPPIAFSGSNFTGDAKSGTVNPGAEPRREIGTRPYA